MNKKIEITEEEEHEIDAIFFILKSSKKYNIIYSNGVELEMIYNQLLDIYDEYPVLKNNCNYVKIRHIRDVNPIINQREDKIAVTFGYGSIIPYYRNS